MKTTIHLPSVKLCSTPAKDLVGKWSIAKDVIYNYEINLTNMKQVAQSFQEIPSTHQYIVLKLVKSTTVSNSILDMQMQSYNIFDVQIECYDNITEAMSSKEQLKALVPENNLGVLLPDKMLHYCLQTYCLALSQYLTRTKSQTVTFDMNESVDISQFIGLGNNMRQYCESSDVQDTTMTFMINLPSNPPPPYPASAPYPGSAPYPIQSYPPPQYPKSAGYPVEGQEPSAQPPPASVQTDPVQTRRNGQRILANFLGLVAGILIIGFGILCIMAVVACIIVVIVI